MIENQDILDDCREKFKVWNSTVRKFNPHHYIKEKVKSINNWFEENQLNAVVIGISGGIDSAVTYRLLQLAASKPKSPLILVHGMCVTISGSTGTTNQHLVASKASKLGYIERIDIGQESDLLFQKFASCTDCFAKGQFDYMLRPAIFYGKVATLQTQGLKPVVVSTINACEMFLGYWGKKSDTCDINIIHDLTKSEVYQVAKLLDIHEDIINAIPQGDVHTGATDEEMIGASYDDIELYMWLHNQNDWGNIIVDEFHDYQPFMNIVKQRKNNAHKFIREIDTVLI